MTAAGYGKRGPAPRVVMTRNPASFKPGAAFTIPGPDRTGRPSRRDSDGEEVRTLPLGHPPSRRVRRRTARADQLELEDAARGTSRWAARGSVTGSTTSPAQPTRPDSDSDGCRPHGQSLRTERSAGPDSSASGLRVERVAKMLHFGDSMATARNHYKEPNNRVHAYR
jgi:hypothetical protein